MSTHTPTHSSARTSTARSARLASPIPCVPTATTLVAALEDVAREEGDRTWIHLLDARNVVTPLSFGEVRDGAARLAADLVARGVSRGDRVVLLLPNGPDFVRSFFGVQLAGAVPVPFAPPAMNGDADKYLANLRHIVESSAPALILTTGRWAETIPQAFGADRPVALAEQLGVGDGPAPAAPRPPSADDPALIQYTSGTTTVPRGIVLSHRAVLANLHGITEALGLTREDMAVSWLPLIHDMGLIGVLLTSLYRRYPIAVMQPEAFLIRPWMWLEAISDLRATITVAPNFAYKLCTRRVSERRMEGLDLSTWRVALNGAEAVDDETVRAFEEKFAAAGFREDVFVPTYGLAENTLAATFPPLSSPYATVDLDAEALRDGRVVRAQPGAEDAKRAVSVGVPMAGHEVAVVDPDGEVVEEEETGEIVVHSPALMDGYAGEEAATREKIRGGWLHTGDQGFVSGGRLYISGRLKEMIIKRGRNYYPCDVERVASAVDGVEADGLIAFAAPNPKDGTEDLVLVAETAATGADERKRIDQGLNSELLGGLGIRADRIVLVSPGSLPRMDDGGIARAACREAFGTARTRGGGP
ncbi:MAG: AMP-binding protein [Myxococcota bacterium]